MSRARDQRRRWALSKIRRRLYFLQRVARGIALDDRIEARRRLRGVGLERALQVTVQRVSDLRLAYADLAGKEGLEDLLHDAQFWARAEHFRARRPARTEGAR